MISKTVEEGINRQIKDELYAAYLYLAMHAHFESSNLKGCASWMRLQAQEELAHGMKLFDYLLGRGGRVALQGVAQPPTSFSSPADVFKQALAHEQHVSADINALYELAIKEKDYPTQIELQWFITEQVEEERSATEIVQQLERIKDDPTGLLLFDRKLGERASTA